MVNMRGTMDVGVSLRARVVRWCCMRAMVCGEERARAFRLSRSAPTQYGFEFVVTTRGAAYVISMGFNHRCSARA